MHLVCQHCSSDFTEEMPSGGEFGAYPMTFTLTGGLAEVFMNSMGQGRANRSVDERNNVQLGMVEAILRQLYDGNMPSSMGDYAIGTNGLDEILNRLMELHDEENRPPCASQSCIDALEREIFSDKSKVKECAVCQEDYVVGKELVVLPCKHTFDPDCVNSWLKVNGTCPICRYSLVTSSPEPQIREIYSVDDLD